MDRNFYDNDFEDFLKQKSDQYKMYPSDRVWNNVYSSLHGRKKWWAFGFVLFFVGTGLLVSRQLISSDLGRVSSQLNKATQSLSPNTSTPSSIRSSGSQPFASPGINEAAAIASAANTAGNNKEMVIDGHGAPAAAINEKSISPAPAQLPLIASLENTLSVIENDPLPATIARTDKNTLNAPALNVGKPVDENSLKTTIKTVPATASAAAVNQVENAAARELPKPSRWSLQFYASPTISYRRLSNTDQQVANPVPAAAGPAGDINRYVRHRPAPGFELGSNVQFKLSDNLSVFAGAQLNYSRYYINAFKYRTEKASIALDKAFVRDTLSGYTDIRNLSGYAPEQLQNKYLQLSVPVGIEIKLLGHKKLQFSVAGGVQPTFLLSSTSYLLSSDYKNYIQSPDLARTFNIHTNFEAFISYQSGGLKWQIGPQFRSQLLSSYSNQYRVREYLTEYGIKIGVTKTFR